MLKWGYKRAREYARRMACYRGEYVPNHPQFAETSTALCKAEITPVASDAADIEYTEEDEKAIEAYTRKFGKDAFLPIIMRRLTFFAISCYGLAFGKWFLIRSLSEVLIGILQLGTCAMKPREEGGVVDSKLNVYGVEGLKVAGTSRQ